MSDPTDPQKHTDDTAAQAGSESPEEGARAEEAAEDAIVDGDPPRRLRAWPEASPEVIA